MRSLADITRIWTETAGGLLLLARLGLVSRFRFRGAYWTWRTETAFGRGWPAGRFGRAIAVLHYAQWLWRMHRLG